MQIEKIKNRISHATHNESVKPKFIDSIKQHALTTPTELMKEKFVDAINKINIAEKMSLAPNTDPQKLALALLDASRAVEECTAIVKLAIQAWQEVLKMPV